MAASSASSSPTRSAGSDARSANHKPRALVVDDEPDIRELLSITLGRMDIAVETRGRLRHGGEAARPASATTWCSPTCACPTATASTSSSGSRTHRPGVPVAVITAHGNVEAAVRALKLGAFDFISKPLDLAALRKLIAATLKLGEDVEETGRYLGHEAASGPRSPCSSCAR